MAHNLISRVSERLLVFSAAVSATESATAAGRNHAIHPYHSLLSREITERLLVFSGGVDQVSLYRLSVCHATALQRRREYTAVEAHQLEPPTDGGQDEYAHNRGRSRKATAGCEPVACH